MSPSPPPSVYDTAPTTGDEPDSGASPCPAAAAMTCSQRTPASMRAVPAAGSIVTAFILPVVTSRPPSAGTGRPCPVACTATGRPRAAAWDTARRTSSGLAAGTITSGRWEASVWKPARSASYPESCR